MTTTAEHATEHAKALAGMRKVVDVTCQRCGKTRPGLARRKWCSRACAQAAYRERRDNEME